MMSVLGRDAGLMITASGAQRWGEAEGEVDRLVLPKRLGRANLALVRRLAQRENGMARKSAEPPGRDFVRSVVDEVSWYMTEHKVSRAELAQSMGVSPGRVSQILSGDENLTLRTLSGVLTALGANFELTLRPALP